ncbi:hypothetical protein SLEP1_g17530 [Rubroshorea leprosula]|uniref:Uncharacterized protein n=2 Tax=Rubroshorea leprosula TaxID=152421 RepID=A0AAV5J537_9ROSI|nr:hypothetical protein SLEP1_g17530 [Rubroshorea leprosula]
MPPASSPCQLRFACWNSGFDRSVTVALGLAFCSVRVRNRNRGRGNQGGSDELEG